MAKKVDFQKLKAKWYKKLEDSGFNDIEQDEERLKSYSTTFSIKNSAVEWEARQEYWHLADRLLNEYSFKSSLDKVIWEYYINGIDLRNIAAILKKAKVKRMGYQTVRRVIKRLEQTMKDLYLAK